MDSDTSLLNWLTNWFLLNCNGDWEHDYGIIIETIDNPGWTITIDLEGTDVDLEDKEWIFSEESSTNWYGYKIKNGKYEASCDPSSLEKIILIFKNMVTTSNSKFPGVDSKN